MKKWMKKHGEKKGEVNMMNIYSSDYYKALDEARKALQGALAAMWATPAYKAYEKALGATGEVYND